MYCKNCGNTMDDNAVICVKCGCAKGTGTTYFPNCGQTTVPGAVACTNCGVGLTNATGEQKSKLAAGLLGIFLGSLGIHNFYLGYTKKAVWQLVLCLAGSCLIVGPMIASIWGLVEGIMILCGKISVDGKGIPLKD